MNKGDEILVILIPGFAASESDTTCLPMQQSFIHCLQKKYPQMPVIVLALQYPYFKKTYQWKGITVTSFAGKNRSGIARLLTRKKIFATLKKLKQERGIKGILSFWYGESAWVGKQFAKRNGIRHLCWIMGQDARAGNPYPQRLQMGGDELIALSDFLKIEFEKNYKIRPAHLVPAGIDPTEFTKTLHPRTVDILGAGSLIPLKRFHLLIEVAAKLKPQFPGIRIVLAGEGPERSGLEELIRRLDLTSEVKLTGEIAHPDLLQLMQTARVFLHPSTYEGFSGVCLEACYAGAEVISFTQPMDQKIEGWEVVDSTDRMVELTATILRKDQNQAKRSNNFLMENTVDQMIKLFNNS